MAGSGDIWGIDIGQCGLKALCCKLADDGQSLVAESFDFIEYPKILSEPDAEPDQLIRDALKEFLSRNNVRGCKVGISVSGQSGLARFIKLPPVESKKIPDIVKYEARQQIPFALEDVVWDYQQMPGGSEEDGFTMETEVGLFAMKRDQLFHTIRPLIDAEVELDVIQLTPLCVYNSAVFDILTDVPAPQDYDPENPPESVVILSMGTDTSDLVVTNGFRVWQRSVPIGGNHFTKALMKELKLTFAKAEDLKRRAQESENAKAVFQAMRSVFADLVTEVQRSIGYFQNIDRAAKIGKIVVLGNAAKLPGLPQYLAKNLNHKVVQLDSFRRLSGAPVTSAPVFRENILSFAVCYGLCLQGAGLAKLSTNLIPREIVRARIIRRKKPWVAGILGVLILGLACNYFLHWGSWYQAHEDRSENGSTWSDSMQLASSVRSESSSLQGEVDELRNQLEQLNALGEGAVSTADRRVLWLELITAINQALPRDPQTQDEQPMSLENLENRKELFIDRVESEYFVDLGEWYVEEISKEYENTISAARRLSRGLPPTDTTTTDETDGNGAGDDAAAGDEMIEDEITDDFDEGATPSGSGWVIEIRGHHFYNPPSGLVGGEYVRQAFLTKLVDNKNPDNLVKLPVMGLDGKTTEVGFTYKELGISFPVLADYNDGALRDIPDPDAVVPDNPSINQSELFEQANRAQRNVRPVKRVRTCEFIVQFVWQEQLGSDRWKAKFQPESATVAGEDFALNP